MVKAADGEPEKDTGPASDVPDWDDLAKRYVDLWQQHVTALSADQELAAQFARLMQGMAAQGAPGAANPLLANPMFAQMFGPMFGGGGDGQSNPPAGATAAGDASGERDQHMVELDRRLAAIEARLDRMAGADGGGD